MDLKEEMNRFYVASVATDMRLSREAGSLDMSYQSLMYVDLIRYMRPCTVGAMAALLGVDKSTVSKRVDDLVRRGVAMKVRDREDGRVFHIRLTPEADVYYDRFDEPYDGAADRIRESLTAEEVEVVCRAMRIMSDHLTGGSG